MLSFYNRVLKSTLVPALAWIGALAALFAQRDGPNFRFVILGDRTGDANQAIYEQVWRDLDREHPDFVLNVGDSIQGGNDATATAEWEALARFWKRYQRYTQYFTPGNHDIWSELSRRVYERQTGRPAFYSFDYQDAHFTVLDNSGSLNLSDTQMQFLAADLEQNRAKHPKFVSFHEPFWLIPLKFQSGAFPFHRLAKRYGVTAVFSGHGHQFVEITQDGIIYLEAGSAGGGLKGEGFTQGWLFGHTLATVHHGAVTFSIRETGPPFGQARTWTP